MDRVALDLGFIKIYWYSIFIFLAMLSACIVIYKEAKKRNIDEDFLVNLTLNTILFGIIGARIYFVLFNLPYYLQHPLEILQMWEGGLAIHGGIFAGLITIVIYCKKKNKDVIEMLDIIVVGLIIAQSIGRWGNFFNSEVYGGITSYEALRSHLVPEFIINGMYINGAYRQPLFLYESVGCLIGFIALLIIRRIKKLKAGSLTAIYLVWYGILRLFTETLRDNEFNLMIGPIKMAQAVSFIFIIAGIVFFVINYNKRDNLRIKNKK